MGKTQEPPLVEEDLRAALREMKTYIDVTEEDLKKIYEIALRHAQQRIDVKIPVGRVMSRNVVTVKRDADFHEAARLLAENRISGMPVVDNDQRVVGVISDADILTLAGMKEGHTFRDVLHRLLGEPIAPRPTDRSRVGDVMSSPPITCKADSDIADVARILDGRKIKRLPVVDDDGKLVGIVSRADIVRVIGKNSEDETREWSQGEGI